MERMNASLIYYKGFTLRPKYRNIDKWLTLFEGESTYRGTQGDFHTHSHDLPPQMGGCYKENNPYQISFSQLIDTGEGLGNFEFNENYDSRYYSRIALQRVIKHKENLIKSNPYDKECFDESNPNDQGRRLKKNDNSHMEENYLDSWYKWVSLIH